MKIAHNHFASNQTKISYGIRSFYLHSSQRNQSGKGSNQHSFGNEHCISFLIDRLRKTHYHFSLFGLFGFGEAFASKQINRFERLLCTLTLFPLIMSRCVSGFRFADVLLFRRFRIAYHSMLIGCIEISLEINAFVVLCILWSVICAFIYSMHKWCANIHTNTHCIPLLFFLNGTNLIQLQCIEACWWFQLKLCLSIIMDDDDDDDDHFGLVTTTQEHDGHVWLLDWYCLTFRLESKPKWSKRWSILMHWARAERCDHFTPST